MQVVILVLQLLVLTICGKDLDRIDDQSPDDFLLKTTTTTEIPLSSLKCTESGRCGCYEGKCWAYIDDKQMPETGWWCFTQREGVRAKEKAWANCIDSDQCSWTMSCGDCYTYVGKEKLIKTTKINC